MPARKQNGVLSRYDTFARHSVETESVLWRSSACKWFVGEVMRLSGAENKRDIELASRFDKGNYQPIRNSDLHIDFRAGRTATKFILTICDVPQAATLFFPEADQDVHESSKYSSFNLYTRSKDSNLLVPKNHGVADLMTTIQAANGQIAQFDIAADVHAAPPIPYGARKILLYGVVRG